MEVKICHLRVENKAKSRHRGYKVLSKIRTSYKLVSHGSRHGK